MRFRARWRSILIALVAGVAIAVGAAIALNKLRARTVSVITGAVVANHPDPHLQRPIAKAVVTASSAGVSTGKAVSEPSGLFRLRIDPPAANGQILELRAEHPDYEPSVVTAPASDAIQVFRLTHRKPEAALPSGHKDIRISNIRVRYATRSTSTNTVGTAVRTFEVVNTANVPCNNQPPCSPDGKWKASIVTRTLDAGEDNRYFRNVRVSCIAGPCPFSAIENDRFTRGGPEITVSVRNWSDTVTYLVEAEVALTMENEMIRYTYPASFGRSMNFTLPAEAMGPSIEADVDGSPIVFPLGPHLKLSWASCNLATTSDGTRRLSCELKPGYVFG